MPGSRKIWLPGSFGNIRPVSCEKNDSDQPPAHEARAFRGGIMEMKKFFREKMNMTPTDYMSLVRVQVACEMLNKSGGTEKS